MCVKLSLFSWQSLQCGVSVVLSMLYFTKLVLIACSCAVQRRLSVFIFSFPFLNDSHFLLSLWNSVSLTSCPFNTFCFHSSNQFSFFSFLRTLTMYICPSWGQLLQSWLAVPYSVLHILLDCISPSRHLTDLFLYHFWYLDSVNTWPWAASPIYGDEFSSLPIHFLKFFLCPLLYSSSISDCWTTPNINSLEYISCI